MSVIAKPMQIIMGLMMMPHGVLIGESSITFWALIALGAAHVAVAFIIICAVVLAARLSPLSHPWINRLHRLSVQHIGAMLGSAIFVAGALHLNFHEMEGV